VIVFGALFSEWENGYAVRFPLPFLFLTHALMTEYSSVVTVTAVKELADSLATVGFDLAAGVLPTLMYYGLIVGVLVGLVALVVYGFRRVFRTH